MERQRKNKSSNKIIFFIFLLLSSNTVIGQERLDMTGTAIIGNKELPKVLYIVPWKASQPIALKTPPFTSVLDEEFLPMERTTLNRQVQYYDYMHTATSVSELK